MSDFMDMVHAASSKIQVEFNKSWAQYNRLEPELQARVLAKTIILAIAAGVITQFTAVSPLAPIVFSVTALYVASSTINRLDSGGKLTELTLAASEIYSKAFGIMNEAKDTVVTRVKRRVEDVADTAFSILKTDEQNKAHESSKQFNREIEDISTQAKRYANYLYQELKFTLSL